METLARGKGSCLCGAIDIFSSEINLNVGACHCHTCLQWGGGPFFGMEAGRNVSVKGNTLTVYQSSDWAERGFCSQCGTHLFYRLQHDHSYILSPGLFEQQLNLTFDHQVFIDQKPKHYCFSNATKNYTGQEVFDRYANDSPPSAQTPS
ncbi:GFA family protein [Alginatibacterium sediminis]|uniref:GFA family protein n=1 Tax=Alginatibacterium sediminis TaxID=2164068 RepID=A0A420E9Q6_9ALTE|nr:GFA family protein [Alginatibacterium sediminis]RKF17400.1 GFA family protein [Alginatibacterium sediminis]